MSKIYMVMGDNGLGNSGDKILGCYPTLELAEARLAECQLAADNGCDSEDDDLAPYCEYMGIIDFEVDPEGANLDISLN
jgi:hypothetical protein